MTRHVKYEKEALLRGWDAVYDLEEFIQAYRLAPLAAREIFAKAGPRRLDLANAMNARAMAVTHHWSITQL
ncbi:hypothetical protein [Ensifer sp. 4252]|uniref:hypothetical protein n=1 Tax=Ensifer sp. 4252 TaxID=3373915 RepID=UPI003D1C79A0